LAVYVARKGEMRNSYKVLVSRPERGVHLKDPDSREENNIKIDLRDKEWEDVEWIHLAEDRDYWRVLLNTVINLRVR